MIRVPEDIRCPPTREALAANLIVQKELFEAWADAKVDTPEKHEEGGWIYFNPFTGKISTRRATPGGSDHEVDLGNPPYMKRSVVAGTYHIHYEPATTTGYWDAEPSGKDQRLANNWGVPGVVLAMLNGEMKIYAYGPNRLGSDPDHANPLAKAAGFPGNSVDTRKLCPP